MNRWHWIVIAAIAVTAYMSRYDMVAVATDSAESRWEAPYRPAVHPCALFTASDTQSASHGHASGRQLTPQIGHSGSMADAATRIRAWLAARDLRRDARAAITGRPDHIVTAIGEAGPVDLTETDLRELMEMVDG